MYVHSVNSVSRLTQYLILLCAMGVANSSMAKSSPRHIADHERLDYLWWEAEDYDQGNFPRSGAFDPQTPEQAEQLSNGRWINTGEQTHPRYHAHYTLQLPQASDYQFYARKFWYHGDFRYRFNGGRWYSVRKSQRHPLLTGSVMLRDHVRMDWIDLGRYPLREGNNTLELELLNTQGAAAFDAFVLSQRAYQPMGLRRPHTRLNHADVGFWSFEPPYDDYRDKSMWDLRSLNEAVAGESGYVRKGQGQHSDDFFLGNGQRVRFWGMNTTVARSSHFYGEPSAQSSSEVAPALSPALKRHARHLAKRGFNMVRFHGGIHSKTDDLLAADTSEINKSWRLVAAMKQEGIYTTLSPYWGVHAKRHPGWSGLAPSKQATLTGLVFFEPEVQKAYKAWLKQWLVPKNPYTGISLAKDPAVALLQLQNEDSLLFWSADQLQAPYKQQLEQQFIRWLSQKYRSPTALKMAWKHDLDGVTFSQGRSDKQQRSSLDNNDGFESVVRTAPLTSLWHLTQAKAHQQRYHDQYQFLVETMQSWNREVARYLRDDIGYQGLINAGNWRTANDTTMLDGERWSYLPQPVTPKAKPKKPEQKPETGTQDKLSAALEGTGTQGEPSAGQYDNHRVVATNRYYHGGEHHNPTAKYRAGFQVNEGDIFQNQSALYRPHRLPMHTKQVYGYPTVISESTWAAPLSYLSEAPFLVAAYSSLQGIDGFYWFSTQNEGFDSSIEKFPAAAPSLMATYPAAALIYRQGYISTPQPIVQEHRLLKNLWRLQAPLLSEAVSYDPNRDEPVPKRKDTVSSMKLSLTDQVRGLWSDLARNYLHNDRRANKESDKDKYNRRHQAPPALLASAFLMGPVTTQYNSSETNTQIATLEHLMDADQGQITSVGQQLQLNYRQGWATINTAYAQGATGFLAGVSPVVLKDLTIETNTHYVTVMAVPLDQNPLNQTKKLLLQVTTQSQPYGFVTVPVEGRESESKGSRGIVGEHSQTLEIKDMGGLPMNMAKHQITIRINNPHIRHATMTDVNGYAVKSVAVAQTENGAVLTLPEEAIYLVLSEQAF